VIVSAFYAARGLVGLLVPQANTTVEPECAMLWPPGVAMLVARMTSAGATIEERLADYQAALDRHAAQFADAPVGVLAVGVTGASYVVGAEAEDRWRSAAADALGRPSTNAALALVAALRALGARRVALVSPYPESLTRLSVAYWTARGFEVAQVQCVEAPAGAGHPVYRLGGDAAASALPGLAGCDPDALLLLGTGMPTLPTLARHPRLGRAPVLSSTLALAWHALECLQGRGLSPSADALLELLDAPAWRHRLADRLGLDDAAALPWDIAAAA
jgi:maleate isomerase